MVQHDHKEDAEQGRGKYAALLYTVVDVKCLGGRAVKLDKPLHVLWNRSLFPALVQWWILNVVK